MVTQTRRSVGVVVAVALGIAAFGHRVVQADSGWVRYHSAATPSTMTVRIKSEKLSGSTYRIYYKVTGTAGYESTDFFTYDCKSRVFQKEKATETFVSGEREIDDERDNQGVGQGIVVSKEIGCNNDVGINIQRYIESLSATPKKKKAKPAGSGLTFGH